MLRVKFQNAIFAVVVGIVLGVTAWAVVERSGGLIGFQNPIADKAAVRTAAEDDEAEGEAKKTRTDLMIERGLLSDHPARFWRKGNGKGQAR